MVMFKTPPNPEEFFVMILAMDTMNPWTTLPYSSPYVLPQDKQASETDKSYAYLRLDTLPEPFIGRLNDAAVVFLALNPGFAQTDIDLNMNSSRFVSAARANLSNRINTPFYYFAGGLEFTGGYKWWRSKLGPLIKDGVRLETLAKKIMCVEYFPYHSVTYKNLKNIIPSQNYSFSLVRQAINENKIIIIMRSKKLWLETVPELTNYPFLELNSSQNVIISPRNIGEINYANLLSALI
jgi:hypothetical protein